MPAINDTNILATMFIVDNGVKQISVHASYCSIYCITPVSGSIELVGIEEKSFLTERLLDMMKWTCQNSINNSRSK